MAIRLLSIPPSSPSVERIFSKHSRIHTKDRNKLTNSRVEKLVAVQAFYQSNVYLDIDSNINNESDSDCDTY